VGASEGLIARRFELTTPTLRFVLREQELSESVAKMARLELPAVALLNVVLEPRQMDQVRELIENYASYRALISDWGFDRVLPYGRGLTLLFSGHSGMGKSTASTSRRWSPSGWVRRRSTSRPSSSRRG
jgi:hypothetical protein